jgi:hypothetical protein
MSELFLGEATGVGKKPWQNVLPHHLAISGESPLARALQRRRREIDHPEVVVATHDSRI